MGKIKGWHQVGRGKVKGFKDVYEHDTQYLQARIQAMPSGGYVVFAEINDVDNINVPTEIVVGDFMRYDDARKALMNYLRRNP